jgi:hypothetical protein
VAINIPIISSLEGKGFDQAILQLKTLETNSERAGFVMGKAFLPAVAALGALTVVAGASVKAAIEDDAAQAQLALALKNVTGATDGQIASVEQQIAAMQMATGVADDELRPAYASLLTGTKSIAEANKALSLAMDVSAATGTDLATVSDALAKAYGGNTRAINQLSPEIKAMIKDGASLAEVQDVLNKNYGGAAATAAGTAQGAFKRLNVALQEAKESIGRALLPAIEAVLPLLISFGNWASDHTSILLAVGTAVGALASAIIAYKIAQLAANAVTIVATALNWELAASAAAVGTASTLGVGAAAIAAGLAVVAGAVLIYKNNNKAATVATTELTQAQKDAAAANDLYARRTNVLGPTFKEYEASVKAVEAANKSNNSTTSTATDKAKALADRVKEAADALQTYMVTALKDAQSELETATTKFDDFAKTVSEGIKDAFSFKDAKTAGDDTGAGFLQGLRDQVKGIVQYGQDVKQLLTMGLSQEALKAVLDAGGESGAAIAKELIAGGTNAIIETNDLVASAQYAADLIGAGAAAQWYGAGVTSAQQYLKGVEDAFAAAQAKLGAKGIKLPDIKGIGAGFSDSLSGPSVIPVSPFRPEQGGGIPGGGVTVNVTGGLDSSAEIGQAVVNAIRAFNRTNGPAQIAVA